MGAFDDLVPSSENSSSGAFDDLVPAPKAKKKDRTTGEFLSDVALSGLQGIDSLVKLPAMVYDKATTGNFYGPETQAISAMSDEREKLKSDYTQAKNQDKSQRIQEVSQAVRDKVGDNPLGIAAQIAAEFGTSFYEAAKDPASIPEFVAQQVPQLFAMGKVGRAGELLAEGAKRVAPKVAATRVGQAVTSKAGEAAAVGAGAVLQGTDVGSDVAQRLMALPDETWQQMPEYVALAEKIGADQAKQEITSRLASEATLKAGAASIGSSMLPGGTAVEKALLGKVPVGVKAIPKAFVGEATQEGIEEGSGAYFGNKAVKEVNPAQNEFENVGNNAGQGAFMGGLLGGGLTGINQAREKLATNLANRAAQTQPEAGTVTDEGTKPAPTSSTFTPSTSQAQPAASDSVASASSDEAEKALKTPVQLTALDRADQLGQEITRLSERRQELTPENGYGPAFDQERADVNNQLLTLQQERDQIASTWPKAVEGAPVQFSTESGARLDGKYALMDAGDLVTSNDENLKVNPLYPQELQPRDRSRQASEIQIGGIVAKMDPARLTISADAATGSPIVGADGLVESGNARTIALKRVYQANGQKAEDYKQYLRDNAAQFGLDPAQIDTMQKPVLVRVRTTPVNRAEFARQANASTTQRMSPSEQALSDSKRLSNLDGLEPDDNGDFDNSRDFIRQFMATLPITEQSDMLESDGKLSTMGYRRIQNAVLAKAYGDSPVLRRMTESMDDNLRNISKALVRVAPTIASARERIDAGTLNDADLTPDLVSAVEGLSALKAKGWTVSQELAQTDLTGPKYSPEASELLQFLDENIRSPRRIAEFVQRYYDALEQAGNPNQATMFDAPETPSRGDLLNRARGDDVSGTATQDPQRGFNREDAQTAEEGGGQPQDAARNQGGNQGDEGAQSSTATDSERTSGGTDARAQAVEDFNQALGDLGAIMRNVSGTKMIREEDHPDLLPTLTKLFSAAIRLGMYKAADATRYVKDQLKADPRFKAIWNKIKPETYAKASRNALDMAQPDGLFESPTVDPAQKAKANDAPEGWTLAAGGKEWIDQHGFIRALELTERERKVEQAFYDAIRTNADALIAKYVAENGAIIDADLAKELLPDYRADKSLARAVHEPSSHLSKLIYAKLLQDAKGKTVLFTAGGGGSGKTEAQENALAALGITEKPHLTYDSTFSSFPSGDKKVRQALDAGAKVLIIYTNRPVDKAFEFALTRSRVVPLVNIAGAHVGASNAIRDAHAKYKNSDDVSVVIVNNQGGRDEIKVGSIGDVPVYGYNEVEDRLFAIAKQSHDSGGISDDKFDTVIRGVRQRSDADASGVVQAYPTSSPGQSVNVDGGTGQALRSVRGTVASGSSTGPGPNSPGSVSQPSLFDGEQNGSSPTGESGATGQQPGTLQNAASQGATGRVRSGNRQGGLFSDSNADTNAAVQGEVGQAGSDGMRGSDQGSGRGKPARGSARSAGIPAGRDIPAKSGRNYTFGPDDLSYAGSWAKKSEQNLDAVELALRLEKEGRQATPEEQKTLAKFVGWGSSEVANNLFGKKLDKVGESLRNYDIANEAFAANGGKPLYRNDRGFYNAFTVMNQAADGKLNYYSMGPITQEDLAKAKPSASDKRWYDMRERLKSLLTPEQYKEASKSTQYAHYTSKSVVQSMWKAMERMGFKGGTILEPGAGIGVFPGLMPQSMANNSVYTGIEFEPVTGAILKQLFPDERILVESFVDSKLPKNFYDVAVGNPPFSSTKILGDPEYAKRAFSLHDYFFAKSIDRVKPGGLVVYVTSRYTMDKLDDKARKYLGERADLVGAIRLPQTAFKQNAGTEVVTDVLFLRKKVPGETFDQAKEWAKVSEIQTPEGPALINQYFADNPDMVLGTHSLQGSQYSANEYTVLPPQGDIETLFAKAIENLPEGIYTTERGSAAEAAKVREIDFNPKAKKEGNYYVTDSGALMIREGGVGQRVELKSAGDMQLVKDFVPLRDALKQAHYDQLNDANWEQSLEALRKEYDKFVAKHGQINQFTTKTSKVKSVDEETGETFTDEVQTRVYPLLNKLRDDPDYSLVAALENINDDTGVITPSVFLTQRVLGKQEAAQVSTPSDALLSVLNDVGHVDTALIADRLGITEAEAIEALGTAVYKDPEQGWVTADDYLSGNVKRKLEAAREAVKQDKSFERNVTALEAAQPAPKTPSQINAGLGMNWIPGELYSQFLNELAGVEARIEWNDRTKSWFVQEQSGGKSLRATSDWGTDSRNTTDLIEHALTGRPIRVTKSEGTGKDRKVVFDAAATEAANQKLEAIKDEFSKWLWQDAQRTDKLVQVYNDTFNTNVARSFDGSHLTLPGTSKAFHIFDHVKRGAWRIIQRGNTYLAHAVGSGKTFQMVIAAMEQKRLGLIKKPMMVVPNHMLKQFAHEWQMLYPAARLMVADENNFHTDNRRRFVSRVALSDLDGVIITHSAFKMLDLDPDFKRQMIEEQLDYMRAALEEAGVKPDEKGRSRDPKIKRIEKQIENYEQKLEALLTSSGKDNNVRFDELGVDQLFVDEAHLFRKLDFTTNRQVKGLDPTGSQGSFDLYMKSRFLEEKNPGRSLIMASGTPVTNTLAELYTVQKFMDRQALEDRGIEDFDSWASMFGRERTVLEPNAAGKYEPVTRFSKFVNVGELTQMFREFADVLTADHLAALLGDKRPKVEGGSRSITVTPKTADYAVFQKELEQRVKTSRQWKPSKEQPYNPDPMIRIIGDGRLAAIDMRFIDPSLPSDPDSKLNRMIDDVIAKFNETKDVEYLDKSTGKPEPNKGSALMVFSDLGFGANVAQTRGFNARAWMEKRLRDAGVPMSQVAFMSDYKASAAKLKLFKDVNAGRVRILVGSSKNMGTGVNAQQRLKALFHLDSPWYPADLEQREGRIIRQGNKNPLVQIYAYAAKGTYDENMWKMLASKQFFIDQALSGDENLREIEDLDSQSQYDMAAAMVAEDPRVLQLAGANAEIEKLQRLYQAHEEQRQRQRDTYNRASNTVSWAQSRMAEAEAAAKKVQDLSGNNFKAKANGKTFKERADWAQALIDTFKELSAKVETGPKVVGEISGFPLVFRGETKGNNYMPKIWLGTPEPMELISNGEMPLAGIAMRAQNAIADVGRTPARLRERIVESKAQMDALSTRLEAPFPMAQMLTDKIKEAEELAAAIAATGQEKTIATDTEEFKKWFGQSKVVDEQGKPLVVYHGAASEVTLFDGEKSKNGFWFSEDMNDASDYGYEITEAYLSIKNPAYFKRTNGDAGVNKAIREAKAAGYDGLIVTSPTFEEGGDANGSTWPTNYVAFEPTQIKSATGNNGQFDPNNPDITLSRANGAISGGVEQGKLQSLVDRIKAKLPNMPEVVVLQEAYQAPDALRKYIVAQGATSDVEGAYHNGKLYLFASGLSDLTRAEFVLAQHEAAHFGLRAILGRNLTNVMNQIYNNNASIRRAVTAMQERGNLTNAQATEEVLVDTPNSELIKLRGWKKLTVMLRNWLEESGFDGLAKKLTQWLDGSLTDQQRADLYAADLVRAARAYVSAKPVGVGRPALAGMALSQGLTDKPDAYAKAVAQWQKAIANAPKENTPLAPAGQSVDMPLPTIYKTLGLKSLNLSLPVRYLQGIRQKHADLPARVLKDLPQLLSDPLLVLPYPNGGYRVVLDVTTAKGEPIVVGLGTDGRVQTVTPLHDQPGLSGVQNLAAMLNTEMKKAGGKIYATNKKALADARASRGIGSTVAKAASAVSSSQAGPASYALLRDPGDKAIVILREKVVNKLGDFGPGIRLSRATPEAVASASERAEKIINTKAASVAPLEYLTRGFTRLSGIERLTGTVYDKLGFLINRYTPERVKAGLVADYGVPQSVIDQRVLMQGRQRVQLRKAGALVDKLSMLTREESRVAYEWMNEGETARADELMKALPAESVAVLRDVQQMIDRLSREAVAMGQLSPEAYERNKFAYLRRSYAKHVMEMTAGEKAKRARVLSILGDQYKGRGLTEEATMRQVQNIAPEWWKRKMAKGKADTSLKGEKFIRLERRSSVGQGTAPLDGMEGRGNGKLKEVVYFPAGETLPNKYSDWDQAGTWEVRDVKGASLVMWRDFTKAERETMGEVDEARFAIAKTLQGMIHDVEVGRHLEWLATTQAKKPGETIPGTVVEASERYRDTFKPDEWVQVPETKIAGTNVAKYGKLAGRYIPGPVWNDLRQVVNGQFKPFGDTYAKILSLWKTSKTALSPAVHMNNVMSNFVMADWHDVTAGHVSKALRIVLAASKGDNKGLLAAAGRGVAKIGISDRDAAREILNRYADSGGDMGSWATNEIANDQLKPLLESLEAELAATGGASVQAQTGVFAALQHAMMLRFPSAWEAFKGSKPGKLVGNEAKTLIDLYQHEDDVFRLAAWLKAKEEGKSDIDAGKASRASFLDYSINAPWVQAMRNSAWPFVSFTYRAVPMMLEIAGKKPHKLMKLMMVAGGLNALGVMLAGGGDDDRERKLLPEEKAGSIWGMVPKLIRMPWNDKFGSPVYLDIRRFIPVGDVFDTGASHSAIPILPGMMPGGPLVLMGEVVLNQSAFTGKPITLDTDTAVQKAAKTADYLYKAFAPNIVGMPGTYATEGVTGSLTGRTDAFGRELSTPQALASAFGIKVGSYPLDVMRRNLKAKADAETMEIQKNISQLKRQRQTNRIDAEEFNQKVLIEKEKQAKIQRELAEKMR